MEIILPLHLIGFLKCVDIFQSDTVLLY